MIVRHWQIMLLKQDEAFYERLADNTQKDGLIASRSFRQAAMYLRQGIEELEEWIPDTH